MQHASLKQAYKLCRRQTKNGYWNAFNLRPGGSALWTTCTALTALGKVVIRSKVKRQPYWLLKSIERGWQCLDQNCEKQTIGFNLNTPSDADSTTWLCRALIVRYQLYQLGIVFGDRDHSDILGWLDKNLNYIEDHIDPSLTGMQTYTTEDQILQYINHYECKSSWLSKHSCVTANTKALGLELSAIPTKNFTKYSLLLAKLKPSKNAFWWTDPRIIDILMGKKMPEDIQLVLRVPEHDDQTGNKTAYNEFTDIEGALSKDDGSFKLSLSIISTSNE